MYLYKNCFFQNLTPASSIKKLHEVPLRSEISSKDQWKLNHIYQTKDDFFKDITEIKTLLKQMLKFKGRLDENANQLFDCLKNADKINIILGKLYGYARMHRDIDAKNSDYQSMTSQIESLLSQASSVLAFIEPELLAMPENKLRQMLLSKASLREYKFFIQDLLRLNKHVLSPLEEELLAKTSELLKAPNNIFSMLTNADLKFPKTPTESGEMVTLSEGRYNSLIRSTDREVRETAFKNLFDTYAAYRNTLATTYASCIKNKIFYTKAKNYSSTLEAALEIDNVPTNVYTKVIDTVHKYFSKLHQYINLKKRFLNLSEIHMYDLYVPLVENVNSNYPYDTGLKLVVDSLKPLGEKYINDLLQGVQNGWVDIYENQGKRTGAYSWGIYDVHPFVLLNYDNKYGAVSTLAHELGHAMHSYYSNEAQPYNTSSYTIFCAEVASTTNEILLLDYMLENEKDPKKRIYFINQYLEQIRTTVYRQTMFAEFEMIVHHKAEADESLTADSFEKIWLDLNKSYYGNEIIIDDEIKIEWARIPHFYRPFYVYKYVTGYAAATTLANNLQTQGQSAQKKYLDYLKSGGSDYSIDLLKVAGVDMTASTPLEITLEKFSSRLKELEELLINS